MKRILRTLIKIASILAGRKRVERALIFCAKCIGVNLHIHGLVEIGALDGYYRQTLNERSFIEEILPLLLPEEKASIFFDVGANIGDYASALGKNFPSASIYAFEPVNKTYQQLLLNLPGTNIKAFNLGLGDKGGASLIYNVENSNNTEVSTLYPEVFANVFKEQGTVEAIEFEIETLDGFCRQHNIDHIDFLKIDVEGHELFVLKGAAEMLAAGRIKVLQFEFNEHNIYARVFLRDFYQCLDNFDIFRLHQDKLIDLGTYDPLNEIFTLQNMIAIRKDMRSLLPEQFIDRFDH